MNKSLPIIIIFVFLSTISLALAQDDWRDSLICVEGDKKACGSNIGICEPGERLCAVGSWGNCVGGTEPSQEVCDNNIDDDCNGAVDDCYFEFPVPGWMLVSIGALMFIGAWVYEKLIVVKKEEMNQEEPE